MVVKNGSEQATGDLGYGSGLANVLIANRYKREGTRNKLLHEAERKEPERKQNMKDMQEQFVGLWASQKSKYTVIVNRKNSAAVHACMQAYRPAMQPWFIIMVLYFSFAFFSSVTISCGM